MSESWGDAIWNHLIDKSGKNNRTKCPPSCKFCSMMDKHTEEELNNMEYKPSPKQK